MTSSNGSFTISRTIQCPVVGVYAAFAEEPIKRQWFQNPAAAAGDYHLDFQVGGQEVNAGTMSDGSTYRFVATYFDITPNQRIVYCYEMYLNDQKVSISLATIEFQAMGQQTQLSMGESGIFFADLDSMQLRQQGTEQLFTALITMLEQTK